MWFEKSNAPTVGRLAEVSVASAICASGSPIHSQLCESETLRQQYTVAGKEPVFINPQDASARGIRNGDVVRL